MASTSISRLLIAPTEISTGQKIGDYEQKTVVWQEEGRQRRQVDYYISPQGRVVFDLKTAKSRRKGSSCAASSAHEGHDLVVEDITDPSEKFGFLIGTEKKMQEWRGLIAGRVAQSEFCSMISLKKAGKFADIVSSWAMEKFPVLFDQLRTGKKPRYPSNPREVLRDEAVRQYPDYLDRLAKEPYILKLRARDGRIVVELAVPQVDDEGKTIRKVLQLYLNGEIRTFIYCRVRKRESIEETVEKFRKKIEQEVSLSTLFQNSSFASLREHSLRLRERRDGEGTIKGFEMPFYIEGSARSLVDNEVPEKIHAMMELRDSYSARSLIFEPPSERDCKYPVVKLKLHFSIIKGVLQFAAGLHERGFTHNALNLDNILIRKNGSRMFAVVINYAEVRKIGAMVVFGTSAYHAPEFSDPSQGDSLVAAPALDNYAIGVMLKELVYGSSLPIQPYDALVDSLREEDMIDGVILGLCRKDPRMRWKAGDAIKTVDQILRHFEAAERV
jgi:serine/threonine protein kinase